MPTLYLDMDGVLADFDGFAKELLGNNNDLGSSERWPEDQWQRLAQVPRLYLNLKKMETADALVNTARRIRDHLGWDLYLLTAIPKGNDVPDSFRDKILWAQFHFPDLPVRFGPYSRDKQQHCRKGDVLVDDRLSNCEQWQARGGLAIRVIKGSEDQARQRLEQLYSELRDTGSSQSQN